jgi:hypothetical protein
MGFRMPRHEEAFSRQPTGKGSKRVEKPAYLDFIRSLPCIVTRKEGVEAAHVSYAEPRAGKMGRGKGAKESDCWAVPLCPEEHRRQHGMDERAYWAAVGIDPVPVAAFLHAAYPSRERALLIINNIVRGSAFTPRADARTGEIDR